MVHKYLVGLSQYYYDHPAQEGSAWVALLRIHILITIHTHLLLTSTTRNAVHQKAYQPCL